MGKTKGPYQAEFEEGSFVQIAPLADLEAFKRDWKWHHPIASDQLADAGHIADMGRSEPLIKEPAR